MPELAAMMRGYDQEHERLESHLSAIDAQMKPLLQTHRSIKDRIESIEKRHESAAAVWGRVVDQMHEDTLYPFTQNALAPDGTLDDYSIAGGELLTSLHSDIDDFNGFAGGIDEPAPLFSITETAGYVGRILPGVSINVREDTELVLPISDGVIFPGDGKHEGVREIEPTPLMHLRSQDVTLRGLSRVLFYGDGAIERWQELLLERGNHSKSFRQWVEINAASTAELAWLRPPVEATLRWKKFLFNSVLSVVGGDYRNAASKITFAEQALTMDGLGFTTLEIDTLEEVIDQAKERVSVSI